MSNPDTIPKRGEIWLVNLDPTIGAEIKKVRPAVVVSSNAIGRLPIKLVAPLTDWKEFFAHEVSPMMMEEIVLAIATVIEYP